MEKNNCSQPKNKNLLLSIFAENHIGVLSKIFSVCRRRLYNIESVTAGHCSIPNVSHITLEISNIHPEKFNQVINQINKIIEVIEINKISRKNDISHRYATLKISNKIKIREKLPSNFKIKTILETDKYNYYGISDDKEKLRETMKTVNFGTKDYLYIYSGISGIKL